MPKLLWLQQRTEQEQPYNVLQSIKALQFYFKDDPDSRQVLSRLESKINVVSDDAEIVGMSNTDVALLSRTIDVLKEYSKTRLRDSITKKNSTFDQIKERIGALDKLSDPAAVEQLSIIESVSSEIDGLNVQLEELNGQLRRADEELAAAKKEYDDLKKNATATRKSSNAYVEMTRYRDALEDFIENKVSSICGSLDKGIGTVHSRSLRSLFAVHRNSKARYTQCNA